MMKRDQEGFVSDTIINTRDYGMMTIKDLISKQFDAIVHGKAYTSTDNGFYYTGTKTVYKMTLSNGLYVRCTSNHKFFTTDYEWKELSQLSVEDELLISNNSTDRDISPSVRKVYTAILQNIFDTSGEIVYKTDGLLGIKINKFDFITPQRCQLMLLTLGINSHLTESKTVDAEDFGSLVITDENIIVFRDTVGFKDEAKMTELCKFLDECGKFLQTESYLARIVDIDEQAEEDVYDCTIPNANCFSANGIITKK